MRNRRPSLSSLLATPVVFVIAIFTSGCWSAHHPPAAFTPPPPRAAPVAAELERLPAPALVASAPDLGESSADSSPNSPATPGLPPDLIPNGVPEAPAPPAPRLPPRRNSVTAPPKPAVATPQPDPQPPPRLGQILSPEQIREYNRTLDESLDRVHKILTVLARKHLSGTQAQILSQIRVFAKQAEEAREQDLMTAALLARRADLLAKDLQERVP